MKLLPIYLLVSSALTVSNANYVYQYNPSKLPKQESLYSLPNYSTDYFGDILKKSQTNQNFNPLENDFESMKKVQSIKKEKNDENIGRYVKYYKKINDAPTLTWDSSIVINPQEQSNTRLKAPPILKAKYPAKNLTFPGHLLKGTTEVPFNVLNIPFEPSTYHVTTATKKSYDNKPVHRSTEKSNNVDKLGIIKVSEVPHIDIINKNIPDHATAKLQNVSTSYPPPVPTLSPWLDGYGK